MKIPQWDVPQFDDGDLVGVEIAAVDGGLDLKFSVDGIPGSPGLMFTRVRGYRCRMESHCTGWHVEDCYMKLVHVPDSEYVRDLKNDTRSGASVDWTHNHYMIFIQDYGSIEVVCEDWQPHGWPD